MLDAALKPVSIDELCRTLGDIAQQLDLPGRGDKGGGTPSQAASNGGEKTPWAAPSPEALQALLDELPNDQGHFDSRDAFVDILHAIKGAAMQAGFEAEARTMTLDWAAIWGGDPAHDEEVWAGIRVPHTGWGYLMRTLERVNPAGAERVKTLVARQAFSQAAAQNQTALSSTPVIAVAAFQPAQIPPRQWLYGRSVITGFLSGLVSPGGTGKSAVMMARAVAMAIGRTLLDRETPIGPLRVWYHNAEDDETEQLRRLAAVEMHYGIAHAALGDRLFLTSGRDLPLHLARMDRDGPEATPGVADWIVDRIKSLSVDVWVLDPLGAVHGLPENSNEAMNFLAGLLRDIMARTGVAIVILHHTSKMAAMDMDSAGAGAARGASAFTDAVRVQEQLVRMTAQEAARLGVPPGERWRYLRVETGKANLSRPEDARWLRRVSVNLGNGTATYPAGDEVGIVESWTPPTQMSGTAADLSRVQAAIHAAAAPPRLDARSPDWVGWLIADRLALDAGSPSVPAKRRTPAQTANYARIAAMLDDWLADGGLCRIEGRDPKSRKTFECVGVGTPALMTEPNQPEGAR